MLALLIDDDVDTHDIVVPYLITCGFDTHSAYTGNYGLEFARQHSPDLILLDIQLPELDGWEICKRIRSFSAVPVLIISAIALEDEDIIHGLKIGADDYLIKPLHLGVLQARINAVLRRTTRTERHQDNQVYVDQYLMADLRRRQINVRGQRIVLSPLEYRLLELLIRNIDRTVPMDSIIEELWLDPVSNDDYARYVRIYIKRLRDAIEPDPGRPRYITTDHRIGYRFTSQR